MDGEQGDPLSAFTVASSSPRFMVGRFGSLLSRGRTRGSLHAGTSRALPVTSRRSRSLPHADAIVARKPGEINAAVSLSRKQPCNRNGELTTAFGNRPSDTESMLPPKPDLGTSRAT
jgi:hypothetical protein